MLTLAIASLCISATLVAQPDSPAILKTGKEIQKELAGAFGTT